MMDATSSWRTYDRRSTISDTKWAEIICGLITISYGIQAIQPGTSQWKALLTIFADSGFVWGGVMLFVGVLSILFAYSLFYKSRFFVALGLCTIWAAVVVLFGRFELAGPPLYNGVIMMAIAVRVMIGAVRHEKQVSHLRCGI